MMEEDDRLATASVSDSESIGEDEEFSSEQQAMMPKAVDEEQPFMVDCDAAAGSANRGSRRFFGGRINGSRVRMGEESWWTEMKNVETSGCGFVLGYLALSFVLMTLMFNMREIVGDYCLGSGELKRAEYRENLEKAMELRRRSPYSADELNRFEKELAADLYYDKQGQVAGDMEYFQNHRVPIVLREDEDELDPDGFRN